NARVGRPAMRLRTRAPCDARTGDRGSRSAYRCLGKSDLILPPFGGVALNAATIGTAAPVGELLQHEAVRHQLTFELGLTCGARRAVFELVRRLRTAGAVDEEPRATFRGGGPNQPHRFGATHEQPDCFDEAGDQGAGSLSDGNTAGNPSHS